MLTILFTGGGGAAAQGWWAAYRGVHSLYFTDDDVEARPPWLPADRWLTKDTPTMTAPLDLLVPGIDEELEARALEAASSIRPAVLLPSHTVISTHLDKYTSMRLLAAAGIPTPRTTLACLSTLADLPTPLILKPRRGRGSRMVRTADTHEEARTLALPHDIAQTKLEGQEYTITAVADRAGTLRAVIPLRVDCKRGVTLRAEVVEDEAAVDLCRAIHRALPWAGSIINIQAIKGADGLMRPFEINPRVSTTTPAACMAALARGTDLLTLAAEDPGADSTPPDLISYYPGLEVRRSWQTQLTWR